VLTVEVTARLAGPGAVVRVRASAPFAPSGADPLEWARRELAPGTAGGESPVTSASAREVELAVPMSRATPVARRPAAVRWG
jgi:hypothetical protein